MPAAPSTYSSAETVAALTAAAALGGSDFKALICLFLFGGADTHNMFVPLDGANRTRYDAARPVGVRITTSETPVNALDLPAGANWRFHPGMDWFKARWDAGQLAVVRHVGTLVRPITRAEFYADPRLRPDQVFSHNTQQDLWQAAIPPLALRSTGWFGRAASLMDPYYNPSQTVSSSLCSTSGNRLQLFPYGTLAPSVLPPSLMPGGNRYSVAQLTFDTAKNRMRHADIATAPAQPLSPKNNIHNIVRDQFNSSVSAQAALNANLQTLTAPQTARFDALTSNGGIKEQVRNAARMLASRTQFGQRRQLIMLASGGWDNHSSLRTFQDPLVAGVDDALAALWTTVVELGLQNNVTIFVETEFSRTLQSNGTSGTDHGWAGHMFVIGGAVTAGVYGPEPDYTINANRDTTQGRFIPELSIEQYYAPLLKWFGVPKPQLPLVLPHLGVFPKAPDFLTTTDPF